MTATKIIESHDAISGINVVAATRLPRQILRKLLCCAFLVLLVATISPQRASAINASGAVTYLQSLSDQSTNTYVGTGGSISIGWS